ncbi:MAG: EF-hand domain-containing protein [Gammaproteobacteria bacterium]
MSGAASDSSMPSGSDSSGKSSSGASGTDASDKSISGASTSQVGATLSVDPSRLSELSADPHVALFNRIDANRDGVISNEELSAGKDKLTLNMDAAAGGKGLDLTNFKNAITNSMLGLTAGSTSTGNMASSPSGSAGTNASTTSSDRNVQGAATDSGGMLDDKAMENVEKEGGPTMQQGGANPSSGTMTPEQTINNPAATDQ